MALKNKKTNEYLKIDFGYLPLPIAKVFKNKEVRDNFNPKYDAYERYDFNVEEFNVEIQTAQADSTLSFIDNFKTLAYNKIKSQLNVEVDGVINIIWEDC